MAIVWRTTQIIALLQIYLGMFSVVNENNINFHDVIASSFRLQGGLGEGRQRGDGNNNTQNMYTIYLIQYYLVHRKNKIFNIFLQLRFYIVKGSTQLATII